MWQAGLVGRISDRRQITRVTLVDEKGKAASTSAQTGADSLTVEEPLEVRISGRPVAITMRTPGHDFDLVAGFAWTEGLITHADQLRDIRYCDGALAGTPGQRGSAAMARLPRVVGSLRPPSSFNIVELGLRDDAPEFEPELARSFYTTSSCGLCGKASIDAIRSQVQFQIHEGVPHVDAATVSGLPAKLRAAQPVFDRTGGLHAAGLFSAAGDLLFVREDVGRHNAVDKLIGAALRDGRLPLSDRILMVSGRASFELVQKAVMAGIAVMAAVSAPSTLAVDLAAEAGMTLIGFVRGPSMNVYAHPSRLSTLV